MGFPQFLIIQEFFLADVSTIPSSTSFSAFFGAGELSLSQAPAKLLPKVTERLADADVSTRGPAHGNIAVDDLDKVHGGFLKSTITITIERNTMKYKDYYICI